MKRLIVASSSQKLNSQIRKILFDRLHLSSISVLSASEVLPLMLDVPDALLILGPLSDLSSIYVAKKAPFSWEVILILKSGEPFLTYVSNVTPIFAPVKPNELCELVSQIGGTELETFGSSVNRKKTRSPDDEKKIEDAKRLIMKTRGLSESEAHRFLQRFAMTAQMTLLKTAELFLLDNDNK